jgi:hypothetical protein
MSCRNQSTHSLLLRLFLFSACTCANPLQVTASKQSSDCYYYTICSLDTSTITHDEPSSNIERVRRVRGHVRFRTGETRSHCCLSFDEKDRHVKGGLCSITSAQPAESDRPPSSFIIRSWLGLAKTSCNDGQLLGNDAAMAVRSDVTTLYDIVHSDCFALTIHLITVHASPNPASLARLSMKVYKLRAF